MSGKWVSFFPDDVPKGRKTKQWTVVPQTDKETRDEADYVELGLVKWHSPWRRYCFFPSPGTLFDAACLRETADFCERRTKAHRARP